MSLLDAHADATSCASRLREALKCAASALKEHGPRFALAGSYALWAYGAPEPSHDVDLVVAEADVETAVATLTNAGFAIERPPEDWLFKARTGDTLVDVLHRINGVPVAADALEQAEVQEVLAISMPVLPPTMVLVQQLRSLGEHHCDFARLLPAVRAVRERLDWQRIAAQTADNDYAAAFLVLAERLGLTRQ
ncbi:nucleotidyltransferase family protein [Mycobacterium intracellulare]|uniref:nucleotidyltransferase family protein n=1 Tax=Mycobacterium intracellulare TaxID=1767 RepID=UPI002010C26D|nr:nucleotidyltransferase family protein [Mycobacterium intracellulare]UQB91367.1 nucleotidyltransferase family protein [Mycobacterium intracellulare]